MKKIEIPEELYEDYKDETRMRVDDFLLTESTFDGYVENLIAVVLDNWIQNEVEKRLAKIAEGEDS